MFDLGQLQQAFGNPYGTGIKKFFQEILGNKVAAHEMIIERLGETIKSQRDYEGIGQLVMAVYQQAFIVAVDQHRQALEKHGLKATVNTNRSIKSK